jgi:hypothetical protein
MKHLLLTLLLAICAATGYGQTIKTLGYNTTNGQIVYSGTNTLTFTNAVLWNANVSAVDLGADNLTVEGAIYFTEALTNLAVTRTNLGLGATWLTNTNVTNFRTAIGLGVTNNVVFQDLQLGTDLLFNGNTGTISWSSNNYISLEDGRIGAGVPSATNDVFVWGPTEVMLRRGINFTNGSASITRTNLGLPLAALTNTSITNFQAALFSTNTAPTNTTNVSAWTTIQIGTNAFRIPLYQ